MTRPVPKIQGDAHEAAAIWYARNRSDVRTPQDAEAFEAWLVESPEHGEAYAEICALAGRLGSLAGHPEIASLSAEAQLFEERRRSRPILWAGGAVAAIATLAAAVFLAVVYLPTMMVERASWTTARGQIEQITLSDGSKVTLGSASRLEIAFRRSGRDVSLVQGQAFFDVAHDAARPFVVTADGRTVTALGTAFDVRVYANETTITLLRGRVSVGREGWISPDAVLKPGQQFRNLAGMISVRDVDAQSETAWRRGILDFSGLTLAEAVVQFNHSAPHSLIIGDPRLAGLRVSGVFRMSDPAAFAAALAPAFPIVATRQSSGDVVLNYKR